MPFYGFSPFPLVANISLPIVEPYSCLIPTADVRIISLPQSLGITDDGEELLYLHPDYQDSFGFVSGSVVMFEGRISHALQLDYQEGEIC